MKTILMVCALLLVGGTASADSPYARVTCPSGSNWSSAYADAGICVRYDSVVDCPDGFEGGPMVSYLGYDLDGFACVCQAGKTDGSGRCVDEGSLPDYTNCPDGWGPVTNQRGVCQPDYYKWGITATTSTWTNDQHWLVAPGVAVIQWNRYYCGVNCSGDFVLHEEFQFYAACNDPIEGWAKDPVDGNACQGAYNILDDVVPPSSTVSYWLFHWLP